MTLADWVYGAIAAAGAVAVLAFVWFEIRCFSRDASIWPMLAAFLVADVLGGIGRWGLFSR